MKGKQKTREEENNGEEGKCKRNKKRQLQGEGREGGNGGLDMSVVKSVTDK